MVLLSRGGGGWRRSMSWALPACLAIILLLRHGEAACSMDIHVDKVALMFLARSNMPLEGIWEPWFRSVANLIPVHPLRRQLCDSHDVAFLHGFECPAFNPALPVLQQQFLFSVYVHSSRENNFREFPGTSVFRGTLVARMGHAMWGDTTEATRILLTEALKDHMNHVFVLLSDTDIPLYPARLAYAQMIQETKSRVDACHSFDHVNLNRYSCSMQEDGIDLHHWRKSNLFMLLTRKHAELIKEDKKIYQSFQEKCSGVLFDEELQEFRGCLVDEHYFATLLAVHGLAQETDCLGVVSMSNFTNSVRGHPKTYEEADIYPEIMPALRRTITWMPQGKCADAATYAASKRTFLPLPVSGDELDCGHLIAQDAFPGMDSLCQLTYRKFAPSTVPKLLEIMTKGANFSNILTL